MAVRYAVFALLTAIWGTTWAAIRVGLEDLPPFTGACLRFAVASLVLLAAGRVLRVPLGATRVERRLWLSNTLFNFLGAYGVVYWAEQYIPSGLAAVLFATFPLFVALLAHFFLPGERLTAAGAVGVLTGFGGVALLFSEDLAGLGGPRAIWAAALMVVSPLAAAVGQILIKRWGEGVHPISLTAVPMGLAAVVLGAVAWLVERGRPVALTPAAVGSVLYLALVGSALAFSLYFWLLAGMRASRVALIAFLTPVVAVLVGVVLFGEPVTWRVAAGTAAVTGGVLLAVRFGLRRPDAARRRGDVPLRDVSPSG